MLLSTTEEKKVTCIQVYCGKMHKAISVPLKSEHWVKLTSDSCKVEKDREIISSHISDLFSLILWDLLSGIIIGHTKYISCILWSLTLK